MSGPAVGAALFAWEDGVERLRRPDPLRDERRRIVAAVHDELRRRLGQTFTTEELADVYRDASRWYLDLAAQTAPRQPEAWDPAIALDGAFGLYRRFAMDGRP